MIDIPKIMAAMVAEDPRYKQRRIKQYYIDMEFFSNALFQIFTRMPAYMTFNNGKLEQYIPKEWQKKIDRVIAEKERFIKENYADLFPEQ